MPQDEQGSGNETALMVWCADRAAAAPVLQALETRFVLDLREELSAAMPTEAGTEVILFYQPLADVLHRAAHDGAAPDRAISAWQEQIRAILALHRQNRRQVRLVDTRAACIHPDAFHRAFGLPGAATAPTADTARSAGDEMLAFLARHYLLEDPEGRALHQALDAASVVLAPPATGRSASEAAFHAYRRQREEAGILREQSRAMQDELAALHRDREALKDEREAAAESDRRAEERIAQLQSRGDTLEAELARVQDEAAEAAEHAALQIDLLQAQTRAMQDELEAMADRSREMDARMRQLGQGLENYQNRIGELRERQDGLQRKLAAKEQSLNAAGRALANLESHTGDLRRALSRGAQDHDRTRAELDMARAEMTALEAEMVRLTHSRSFRLTAPLRRVAALLSGGGRS